MSFFYNTYSEKRECLLVTLITFHFDINVDGIFGKINLGIILVLCKNTQNDICLSLIPISTTINKFFSL